MNRPMKWMFALGVSLFSMHAMADITIYNGQHKAGTMALAKAFTQKTGIKVHIKSGSSAQLAGQLAEEGLATPADVFFAEELSPMLSLSQKGDLAKLDNQTIEATHFPGVPQAGNKDWVAISGRARVVVYDPSKINKNELPHSILKYATKKWKGRIGYVATSGAFLSQVIAITKMDGKDAALNWLEGLKKYGKLYTSNHVALAAVERGEVPAALINNYYWYNLVRERGGKDKVNSRLFFIGQHDAGALMTYSTMAVLKGSKHAQQAQKFVRFAVSKKGQEAFTSVRAEYPLRPDVTSSFKMHPYAEIEPPHLTPITNKDKQEAIHLLEEAGLK